MSEQTDHVALALSSLDMTDDQRQILAHETGDGRNVRVAIDELKHATLALVEQQRIANLIAVQAQPGMRVTPDIAAALGINEGDRS